MYYVLVTEEGSTDPTPVAVKVRNGALVLVNPDDLKEEEREEEEEEEKETKKAPPPVGKKV